MAQIYVDATITGVQARLDREATIDNLKAETKRVMINAGKSYLKCKMDGPQSSNTPEIILEVSDNLLKAPPAPQPHYNYAPHHSTGHSSTPQQPYSHSSIAWLPRQTQPTASLLNRPSSHQHSR